MSIYTKMLDANLGGVDCIVADRSCSRFDPCRSCVEELEHRQVVRRMRECNEARNRTNDTVVAVAVEYPGATLVTLGLIGAVAGGVKLAEHLREKRAAKRVGRR